MVYKDGIFNVMDKVFSIAINSRSRILKQCNGWPYPFSLQNVKKPLRWPGVAIETPSLHFLKKMDKAFSIAIDSRSRILKQCNGVASETLSLHFITFFTLQAK